MSIYSRHEVTKKLQAWGEGDKQALNDLIPVIYDELHKQASHYIHRERPSHTLQTTALINETYIKLVKQKGIHWQNRAQFFGIASRLMRRILIDYARAKHREKRGGHIVQISSEEGVEEGIVNLKDEKAIDLIALDEAITRLAKFDERQTHIVEMKFFAGLNIKEIAQVLNVSIATVKRDWQMARAWLYKELS